jgi:hypothetical protein
LYRSTHWADDSPGKRNGTLGTPIGIRFKKFIEK